jgi:TRAP-type C4-dicarboxylate transport system permease small subunit
MPLIAFMGISFLQRDGGHIRMDMFVRILKGRGLYVVELITSCAILLLMLAILWGSWAHFERSFDFSAPLWSRDSSMDIALPIWPAKLLAPIAFFVLCLRLIIQIWAYIRAIIQNDGRPVAIPLVPDVVAQAAQEAEQVSGRDD